MTTTLDDAGIIDAVIAREGSEYTDREVDVGGPTKYGITLATLAAGRGEAVSSSQVAALEIEEVRLIYFERYIKRPGFDRIDDDRLRALVVDCAVLHGPGDAVRWLQEAINAGRRRQKALGTIYLTVDGVLGPITRAALSLPATTDQLRRRITALRCRYIARLVQDRPSQIVFFEGWIRRATEFLMED